MIRVHPMESLLHIVDDSLELVCEKITSRCVAITFPKGRNKLWKTGLVFCFSFYARRAKIKYSCTWLVNIHLKFSVWFCSLAFSLAPYKWEGRCLHPASLSHISFCPPHTSCLLTMINGLETLPTLRSRPHSLSLSANISWTFLCEGMLLGTVEDGRTIVGEQ